jgi:hypothetical protein
MMVLRAILLYGLATAWWVILFTAALILSHHADFGRLVLIVFVGTALSGPVMHKSFRGIAPSMSREHFLWRGFDPCFALDRSGFELVGARTLG